MPPTRLPWRSPPDQPPWARPCLLAVAGLAVVVYGWNIRHSEYQGYYSMAARSMSGSWKAFLFGAVDPTASITIDKVPGFLWPQALSARIFGFHPWTLMLPQVIEGGVSVLVLYRVVRRWAGPATGLAAAGIFAITPITAVIFGHSLTADPALTMCLILAADAWQEAADSARLRPLLLAGVWVGLGFQAKMLQAWAVLPAFAVVYLAVAAATWRQRVRHVLLAGLVTLAVSASWVVMVMLVPPSARPYVDGTTNNSAFTMVVGYNGLDRFGLHLPGALGTTGTGGPRPSAGTAGPRPSAGTAGPRPSAGTGGPRPSAGTGAPRASAGPGGPVTGIPGLAPFPQPLPPGAAQPAHGGWAKLFGAYLATQVGWLYPLAAVGLIAGLARRRGSPRTDRTRSGYLMWGLWLAATGLAFSAGEVAHAAYTAALAAPLAALAAAGLLTLWRMFRDGGQAVWLLPAAIVVEAAWTGYLTTRYPSFLPWLLPVTIGLAAIALAALIAATSTGRTRRGWAMLALAAGTTSMLLTPAAWATSTVDSRYAGNALEAYAGPASGPPGAIGPYLRSYQSGALTAAQARIVDYTTRHRDGATYLFATDSWRTASPYILATGAPVLPMGGFSGEVASPTLEQFRHLVSTGQLRHVLLSSDGFSIFALLGGAPHATPTTEITGWVRHHCTPVPLDGAPGTLYACDPRTA